MFGRIVALGRVLKDRGDVLLDELVAVVREKLLPVLVEVAQAAGRYVAHRWGLFMRWWG